MQNARRGHRDPGAGQPAGLRRAAHQLERADLYLAAVENMELGAPDLRREVSRIRWEVDQLRRRLRHGRVV